MQVFNVGILELLFILIIAFIVLGPAKTVKTMGDVGRWIKNLSKSPIWQDLMATSQEIRDLPNKIMDEAELEKTLRELERSTDEINRSLHQVQAETEQELSEINEEIKQENP